MKKKEIIEELAALEHEQWMEFAKGIAAEEKLSQKRLKRWEKLFIPYEELSEEMKELDRKWAHKVYDILKNRNNNQ